MGDIQFLMGSIFAKIYDNSSENAWHKWTFDTWANQSFEKISRLYSAGDFDHALIEVFRLIESNLRSIYLLYSGAFEKMIGVFSDVYTKYQSADYYPDPRDFDPSVRGFVRDVNREKLEKIITELKALSVLNEGEMHLLYALKYYRNEVAHGLDEETPKGVCEALLLTAIPLIRRLEEEKVSAEKRVKQKIEREKKSS